MIYSKIHFFDAVYLSFEEKSERMSRGVSSGGGQSSLGYLFGSDEAPAPAKSPAKSSPPDITAPPQNPAAPAPVDNSRQIPAGIQGNNVNNYLRADGQNSGNFITVWALSLCPNSIILLCLTLAPWPRFSRAAH